MSEPTNLFAPPNAELQADLRVSRDLELASLGARLAGALLDILTFMLGVFLCFLVFGVGFGSLSMIAGGSGLQALAFLGVAAALSAAIFGVLQIVLLLRRGQTVGKIIVGTRIVRPDGSKPSAGRLLLRYLVPGFMSLIPFVGKLLQLINILMIFRESRRCLHDDMVDTIVIKV